MKNVFSRHFQHAWQVPLFFTAASVCVSLALEGCRNPTIVAPGGVTSADGVKGAATRVTVAPGQAGTPEGENTGSLPAESPRGELPPSLPGVSAALPARPAGWA